ncbi:MAG TPA: prenyltransferase/squalene oxidase repeat-containing protein, partial [Candidatus Saccharimonadales bacterium]|nr:prenyltransferase/squalene oxidase repeat-containing protein [Candidatus Saccharimonadales bacterium]
MPKKLELESAIAKGLAYISKQQTADGGFASFSSPASDDFTEAKTYRTTFVPALMLGCLSSVDSPSSQSIRQRLAKFMMEQKDPQWSFNYWAKNAPERTTLPYPDDLDDTFCALIGLALNDPASITAEVLAKVVKLLLATETQVGGPYHTWLVAKNSDKVWLDIDLAVNSNIAYFLSLVSQSLPNLTTFMEQAITSNKLTSPYYPSAYPLVYYLSRAYSGEHTSKFLKNAQELAAKASNPLQTALCLSSLLHLGSPKPSDLLVAKLLAGQQSDGSWPAAAFCLDPSLEGKPYYHGASSLTTAFVLEALALFAEQGINRYSPASPHIVKSDDQPGKHFQLEVASSAKKLCWPLGPDLGQSMKLGLNRMFESSDGLEIINLPHYFNQSLAKPLAAKFNGSLINLGAANLFGWLAYTIYDDFLDDEGQPEALPIANVAMRNSLLCFAAAVPNPDFQALVHETFDKIDGANAWEPANCRFQRLGDQLVVNKLPNYGNLAKLAERSLGHCLTPLAVLSLNGLSANSSAFQNLQKALKHYLIARQLNDDAHDWQEDIEKGQITYVVSQILAEAKVIPGKHDLAAM